MGRTGSRSSPVRHSSCALQTGCLLSACRRDEANPSGRSAVAPNQKPRQSRMGIASEVNAWGRSSSCLTQVCGIVPCAAVPCTEARVCVCLCLRCVKNSLGPDSMGGGVQNFLFKRAGDARRPDATLSGLT